MTPKDFWNNFKRLYMVQKDLSRKFQILNEAQEKDKEAMGTLNNDLWELRKLVASLLEQHGVTIADTPGTQATYQSLYKPLATQLQDLHSLQEQGKGNLKDLDDQVQQLRTFILNLQQAPRVKIKGKKGKKATIQDDQEGEGEKESEDEQGMTEAQMSRYYDQTMSSAYQIQDSLMQNYNDIKDIHMDEEAPQKFLPSTFGALSMDNLKWEEQNQNMLLMISRVMPGILTPIYTQITEIQNFLDQLYPVQDDSFYDQAEPNSQLDEGSIRRPDTLERPGSPQKMSHPTSVPPSPAPAPSVSSAQDRFLPNKQRQEQGLNQEIKTGQTSQPQSPVKNLNLVIKPPNRGLSRGDPNLKGNIKDEVRLMVEDVVIQQMKKLAFGPQVINFAEQAKLVAQGKGEGGFVSAVVGGQASPQTMGQGLDPSQVMLVQEQLKLIRNQLQQMAPMAELNKLKTLLLQGFAHQDDIQKEVVKGEAIQPSSQGGPPPGSPPHRPQPSNAAQNFIIMEMLQNKATIADLDQIKEQIIDSLRGMDDKLEEKNHQNLVLIKNVHTYLSQLENKNKGGFSQPISLSEIERHIRYNLETSHQYAQTGSMYQRPLRDLSGQDGPGIALGDGGDYQQEQREVQQGGTGSQGFQLPSYQSNFRQNVLQQQQHQQQQQPQQDDYYRPVMQGGQVITQGGQQHFRDGQGSPQGQRVGHQGAGKLQGAPPSPQDDTALRNQVTNNAKAIRDLEDQIQRLSLKLAKLESMVKVSQNQNMPRTYAAPSSDKDLDAKVQRLIIDVGNLKRKQGSQKQPHPVSVQTLIPQLNDGDYAMLAAKPLLGYRCMACDRPLDRLEDHAGPHIPQNVFPFQLQPQGPTDIKQVKDKQDLQSQVIKLSQVMAQLQSISSNPKTNKSIRTYVQQASYLDGAAANDLGPSGGQIRRGPQSWYEERKGLPADRLPKGDVGPHLPKGGWRTQNQNGPVSAQRSRASSQRNSQVDMQE